MDALEVPGGGGGAVPWNPSLAADAVFHALAPDAAARERLLFAEPKAARAAAASPLVPRVPGGITAAAAAAASPDSTPTSAAGARRGDPKALFMGGRER